MMEMLQVSSMWIFSFSTTGGIGQLHLLSPPALYNFQEWLANEGLQVQDGIQPANNLQDSPAVAWNDSISLQRSSSSSSGSDALVLVLVSIMQALQRNGALNFNAPGQQPQIMQDSGTIVPSGSVTNPQQIQFNLSVSNAGININFAAENEVLGSMLLNESFSYVPITNFL